MRSSVHPAIGDSEAVTEGLPVLIVDEERRCVEVNDEASNLLGLERSQIVGRSIESLELPEGYLLVLPRIEHVPAAEPRTGRAPGADGRTRGKVPSRREREVLTLLARGATDTQIAEKLALSPTTVQTHVRNAKTKLGARTRAQAVALSLVSGLIDLD
ncbi:MAG: LuxR C-terminal-related transcriptional regulator [Actinomycetota bacterium]|nr:LuxR C-terminal-related transcriptional regulator [Actinomycetota bacterium]